jgi:ComF family protein
MFTGIRKAIFAAVFPTRCQACRKFFHPPETPTDAMDTPPSSRDMVLEDPFPMDMFFQDIMTPFLCRACITRFSPMQTPWCPACGKMFEARNGQDHVCGTCMTSDNRYQAVRSAGLLEGALMDVIHALKYNGRIALARPLGRILLAALMRHFSTDDIDMVIPVPLHPNRLRNRGFNQALLMLREWPDFPAIQRAGIVIEKTILVRRINTASQTGLGREKRKANVRHAFAVNSPEKVKGKRVLLIDDVFTTGATCRECAKVLEKAGAAAVSILTLAHAG